MHPLIGPAAPGTLHVMSMNLRNPGAGQPDPWDDRRGVTAALLETERPTVLGTQEGFYHQLRDIADDLPSGYDWIGTGRDGGSRGEFMAIFFDSVRLEPLEYDHFWLSDTPDLVGSTSWGNSNVRMATWVRFADRTAEHANGREFVLLNTHLDHAVARAQREGAALVADRVRELARTYPVIVTGDFNVPAENSEPYRILVDGANLADSWKITDKALTPSVATFHGYGDPTPNGDRIDWILTSRGITVDSAAINTFRMPAAGAESRSRPTPDFQPEDPPAAVAPVVASGFTAEGGWASDHWPVQALVRLP